MFNTLRLCNPDYARVTAWKSGISTEEVKPLNGSVQPEIVYQIPGSSQKGTLINHISRTNQ